MKGKKGHEIELIEKINEKQQLITSDFILICLQQTRKYSPKSYTNTLTHHMYSYVIIFLSLKLNHLREIRGSLSSIM